jgi:hypothetical protein
VDDAGSPTSTGLVLTPSRTPNAPLRGCWRARSTDFRGPGEAGKVKIFRLQRVAFSFSCRISAISWLIWAAKALLQGSVRAPLFHFSIRTRNNRIPDFAHQTCSSPQSISSCVWSSREFARSARQLVRPPCPKSEQFQRAERLATPSRDNSRRNWDTNQSGSLGQRRPPPPLATMRSFPLNDAERHADSYFRGIKDSRGDDKMSRVIGAYRTPTFVLARRHVAEDS